MAKKYKNKNFNNKTDGDFYFKLHPDLMNLTDADFLVTHPRFKPKISKEESLKWYKSNPEEATKHLNEIEILDKEDRNKVLLQVIHETLLLKAPKLINRFTKSPRHFECSTSMGSIKMSIDEDFWCGWLEKSLRSLGACQVDQIISAVDKKLESL